MSAYFYIKKPFRKQTQAQSWAVSTLFLSTGLLMLGMVVWPIMSFQLLTAPKFSAKIISPLASQQVLGLQTDFTQASNWFPTAVIPKTSLSKISSYTLSIPKLKIEGATVVIGDNDLSKHLIQWGGTGVPGEYGNSVIFGHSVLPAFFDPKNYKTIFSTLPTLKENDEIFVYFDGITYKYQVIEMKVINPDDLSVLEQKYDTSYISLVTCVPPGTYWKRLVVKARLIKI